LLLGTVHFKKTSAVKGSSPVRTFCGQGEMVLQIQTTALFSAKNWIFGEIYGVPTRTWMG